MNPGGFRPIKFLDDFIAPFPFQRNYCLGSAWAIS